ncbi:DUF1294 domain-containing protein [bacterium]|nr:MAG: DUF1294 domain-containing protein [bacterium]
MPSESPRRYQGEIIEWNEAKRCGFIADRGSGPDDPPIFLPVEALIYSKTAPSVGARVTYELATVPDTPQTKRLRTKLRAQQVLFEGEEMPLPPDRRGEKVLAFIGMMHLVAQVIATALFPQTLWILLASVAFSTAAFALYAWDKRAAQTRRRRVPEYELNLFALMGGWPGAAFAQSYFRHKTQKRTFRLIFFQAIVLNMILTYLAYGFFVTRFK